MSNGTGHPGWQPTLSVVSNPARDEALTQCVRQLERFPTDDLVALRLVGGDTSMLYPGVKRLMNPHHYHVSLTEKLWNIKQNLMYEYKKKKKD